MLSRPAPLPDAVLRYGEHEDAVLDVHLPTSTAPAPLVVLVHGGFWRQRWDRRHVRPLAAAFTALGVVVAVPEYRRTGGGGGWPATFDDVREAVRRIPGLLASIGVQTTTTTLVGHSAGGQLVLWLATEELGGDRVVGLAPVADLAYAAERRLGDGAVLDLLGGTPTERPDRYAAADPAVRLGNRPEADVVVVHGDRDAHVPAESSRRLVGRHPWIGYRELAGVEHFGLIDPLSAAWPTVRAAVLGDGGTLST